MKGTNGMNKAIAFVLKNKLLLMVLAAGLLLLLFSAQRGESGGGTAETPEYEAYPLAQAEAEMAAALSAISGAGKVTVMLTLESDCTVLYQQNEKSSDNRAYEEGVLGSYQKTADLQTVLVGSGADSRPVITQRVYPTFRGALVVCEGAGSPAVRLAVVEAVSALTGLGSDKISVQKGK